MNQFSKAVGRVAAACVLFMSGLAMAGDGGAEAVALVPHDEAPELAAHDGEPLAVEERSVAFAAEVRLYDNYDMHYAEFDYNDCPDLPGQLLTVYDEDGSVVHVSDWSRALFGGMPGSAGEGYYVEFSSDVTPSVGGYWGKGYAMANSGYAPFWLVPVDGEAVGLDYRSSGASYDFPDDDFVYFTIRPFFAWGDPIVGMGIAQQVSRLNSVEEPFTVTITYLEGNALYGREPDVEVWYGNIPIGLCWEDRIAGRQVHWESPVGPIELRVEHPWFSDFVRTMTLEQDFLYAVQPVLWADSPEAEHMFRLPSVTPDPVPPYPFSSESVLTGALVGEDASVDDWSVHR